LFPYDKTIICQDRLGTRAEGKLKKGGGFAQSNNMLEASLGEINLQIN
jgi:hypothetical protein